MESAEALEARLISDLGLQFFGTIGGATSKLAAMKAKLQGRDKASSKKRFAVFGSLEGSALSRVREALAAEQVVAVRCTRDAAVASWPAVADACAAKVGRKDLGANVHVALGSLVAMSGPHCWCVGGWADQRDVQQAGAAIVAESKRRSADGDRSIFISRPEPQCCDAELAARAEHLFASVPEPGSLQLDEEAAYSVSNETSAAKVAAVAYKLGAVDLVVDATACVGGNTIAFARTFPTVVAVEIDPTKAAKLRHNVAHVRRSATLGRVDVVAGDCLVELPRLDAWARARTAVVFADPPWGGRHYKYKDEPEVHLKGDSGGLPDLVAFCAGRAEVRHLLLKVPFNFDSAALAASRHVRRLDTVLLSNKVTLLVLHLHDKAARPEPEQQAKKKKKKKKKREKRDRDDEDELRKRQKAAG